MHAPTFDLQSHSQHSDGSLTPREVVAAAAAAGVELLALTDHDTVDGVSEAAGAAGDAGIGLVTGVEISALYAGERDLHILGYDLEYRDPILRERLASYRADRERRTEAMVTALKELGFELDEASLNRRAAEGRSIGRPHIARAVTDHRANRERLATDAISEPGAFLEAYLVPGAPAFRAREHPTVADAIAVIHDANGVAVWAHPFFDFSDPEKVLAALERFRAEGLDGVECFYITHSAEQTAIIAERCAEHGLLSTGSSDFHGPEHAMLSRFRAFSTYGFEPILGPLDRTRTP
jgi:predicted metal-dependent phosphoesterase TrpH